VHDDLNERSLREFHLSTVKTASYFGRGTLRTLAIIGCGCWLPASTLLAQTDPGFTVDTDQPIYAMTVGVDGKITVGGSFGMLNGTPRNALARLSGDGSLDPGFNPGANGTVYGLAVQPDGKLIVAGGFTTLAGTNRSRLGRLNSDGSVDLTFAPGADGDILALAMQADGKILVGGTFANLAGTPRTRIGRLNPNGSIDATFNAQAAGTVRTLAVQPDGQILVGGEFQTVNAVSANYLCRLTTNGTLDGSFIASADNQVHSLAVQADGRILVGGLFIYVNGQMHLGLARLNPDGSPDSSFTAAVRPGYLGDSDTIAIQSDGRFLVGGTAVGWFAYPYFARFNYDGTKDNNFTANVPSGVHSIAIQRSGSILHATYSTFGTVTNYAAMDSLSRFTATNLTYITWTRDGGGPEVWRTTFETSSNRTNWTMLGAGTRYNGYWQMGGVTVATNAYIRARGYVANGYQNASSWFVQAFLGPVIIVDQPFNRTNNAGTTATFSVVADGSPALGYRWRKNGVNLSDGANILGTATPTLTLSNVLQANAAAYSVVITNSFGAVTSSVANLTVIDPYINSHPTNLFIDAGQSATFSVNVTGSPPISYQWKKNGTNFPGATAATLTLTNASIIDAGSTWQVVVTNAFGTRTSAVARLNVNGALADGFNPVPNGPIYSLAVQADRKVVMGGWFSWVGNQVRPGVTRLEANGALDMSFAGSIIGDPDSPARPTVALQEDGRILIAGGVFSANDARRNQIARLYPDGNVDNEFSPSAAGDVYAMAIQSDGKILVGGTFTNLAGLACNRLGRLNPDGTLDTNFVASVNGTVNDIAVQPDGRILAGGNFIAPGLNSTSHTNLVRLKPDGSVDDTLYPGTDGTVYSLAVQGDGSILVGGTFTSLGGQSRSRIGRLTASGNVDAGFNPGADGDVLTLVVQVDGRICVGGYFSTMAGQPRNNLGRLNPDGSADLTFNPGANGTVNSLALQPDGMLLVAGDFTVLDGQNRPYIGRVSATGAAVQSLAYSSTTITWQRSGTGPEVLNAFFDVATNANHLVRIPGNRTAGGWQATGLNMPTGACVRVRGWVAGSSIGSSWYAENALGPAVIERQPTHTTKDVFTAAAFQILALGEAPLDYRWLRNGTPLTNDANLSGTLSSTLNLSSVSGSNAGSYQCVVSNGFGSVTSLVATLTVRDPLVTSQPAGLTLNAGDTATFYANATGTPPLGYYWLKDGVPLTNGGNISGADSSALTVANVFGGDAGYYSAVATNAWGSATSAVARLTVRDPLVITNPISQLVHRGGTTLLSVLVGGSAPLQYQWRKDGFALLNATNATLSLTNFQASDAGNYDVLAANTFGTVTSLVATLSFNSAVPDVLNPGANAEVYAVALQPDGKLFLGGAFTTIGGQARNHIARLNTDGTLDPNFNPGAGGSVWSFGIQPDGRILVGGSFTTFAGQSLANLGRLNPDGTLDATFNPNPVTSPASSSRVFTILPHSDGSILIGGVFSQVGGISHLGIARLHADGSLDPDFNAGVDGFVCSLAEQLNGRILVGGAFNTLNGESRAGLGRLYANGTVDSTFTNVASSYIYALAEQPDGKILVGGWFSSLVGQTRSSIGRLNADGSLDETFNPAPDNAVYSIRLQADGQMLIGGFFGTVAGQPRGRLAKLTPDGLVEPGFNPNANGSVYSLVGQPDGSFVIGGSFTSVSGQPRNRIARLIDTTAATESLGADATSVTWLRGGAAPEVARTSFETTTNGTDWTLLGPGARIAGGWQITGLSLPPNATLRARGFTTSGGFQSSSSWFVESIIGTPCIVSSPINQTNNAGTTATSSVVGIDRLPASYQWLKNGSPVPNSVNVSGANASTLVLTNVLGADAGSYQVVLSNAWGSITSSVATLTVVDPLITTQPIGQAANAGQTVTLSVSATGTLPLAYQWYLEGTPLAAGTNSTLSLTNVQAAAAGAYTVVVSNQFGTVSSAPALLAVNLAVPDGFNPGSGSVAGPFLFQPDGKIVIGGYFGNTLTRRFLARFNPDGSPDPSFLYSNVVVDVSATYCLALEPDGRMLGSGLGRQQLPTSLWRLNPDGTVDASFTNQIAGTIYGLVQRPDGRIWTGGGFSYMKPSILTNLALVSPAGTVDTNLLTGVNNTIQTLALQPDGQLLAGGNFTLVNGHTATRLARFTSSGLLDASFNPSANNSVYSLVVQPDGKILVAGIFTTLNSSNINRLGRLNPDGSLDTGFNPNVNGTVYSLALQADGRIVLGGGFSTISGQPRSRLARLNADGSLDPTFNPTVSGGNAVVYDVGLQADGALLVTGGFSQINGQYRTNIARLTPTGPAIQSLSYDGTNLTWLRSGTAPEVWRTSFEVSTNGSSWTQLGAGQRIAGGWQLPFVSLPEHAHVRVRGFTSGAQNNGASWFVESLLGPSLITSQPASRTNLAGTTATFWVSAGGTAPLSYQWLRDGHPLAEGANLSGVTTATLVISNVLGGDMGHYSVIVSNSAASVTSSEAMLLVIDPIITTQPTSVFTNAGETVSFSVTAIGTSPLTYQWRKDGTNLFAATSSTLVLPDAQSADLGAYSVVVLGPFGAAPSQSANLTLNLALPDALAPELDDQVRSLATQPDGKILIGGNFSHLGSDWFYNFGRLNADGTLDTNFYGHVNSSADTVAVQPDGNVLVGGWFTYANDWPHSRICRFYPDGGLDPFINPSITSSTLSPSVDSLVPQPDGKFLLGGWFTSLAGQNRNYLGRFNADGTLDTFNPGANSQVMVLALQADGKVIAAGQFTILGGQPRNRIGRLFPDGSLDSSFDPNANNTVNAVVVQPDGKILVAGAFTSIAAQNRSYLARLNPDGTADSTLNVSLNGGLSGIALQADGGIILAGAFTTIAGQARTGLARISTTGVVDPNWSPQIVGGAGGVAIQADGKVLLCGTISNVCGQTRSRLARLMTVGTATHRLQCDALGVTWLRDGSSPEISGVGFELSVDGTHWTSLGSATRVPGGWRVGTTDLTINSQVRARGFHSGGRWNGSLSLIEDTIQVPPLTPPAIITDDGSLGYGTNQFRFTVRALAGQTLVVEATTDFSSWMPLQTNLVSTPPEFQVIDRQTAPYAHRFYRARLYQ